MTKVHTRNCPDYRESVFALSGQQSSYVIQFNDTKDGGIPPGGG